MPFIDTQDAYRIYLMAVNVDHLNECLAGVAEFAIHIDDDDGRPFIDVVEFEKLSEPAK